LIGNFSFINLEWLEVGLDGLYGDRAQTDQYGNYINYGSCPSGQ
jgi:hypothetical protein